MQFSIGDDELAGQPAVRFAVVFSLEVNQTLPIIEPLVPKIARFNEYIREHPEDFHRLRMRCGVVGQAGYDGAVSPVEDRFIIDGGFIAVGCWVPPGEARIPAILDVFDQLLLDFGVRVDTAVRRDGAIVFYEVKVTNDVQSCVRAVGASGWFAATTG